jgi:ATP-binding cassette subfamily B protein
MPSVHAFEDERLASMSRREVVVGLWPLFRPHLVHFLGSFILLTVASGLVVVGPILVKRAIDQDIANRDPEGLTTTVLLYLGCQLLHLVVVYVMRNWLEATGQRMMAGLKTQLVNHALTLPMGFFDREPPGRLLSRVTSDTESLRMLFTTTSVMVVGDLLLFVGMFSVMAIESWPLTLVTAVIIPILVGLTVYFQRRIHPRFLAARARSADIAARLAEFIQGMPVIQAFARRSWAVARFQEVNLAKYEEAWGGERLVVLWFNSAFLTRSLAFGLILGVGGWWALSGMVTIGTLAMFMGYVRRFFDPLFRLSDQMAVIQKALASAERIFLLLREDATVRDPHAPREWPGLRRSVRFEGVWFRYVDEGDWILKDVSFEIPAGEHWAVVGPTGSGKTTLVALLLRFYEPQRGRILVDGVDIRELAQKELRSRVGLVLQDIYLFPGTLRDNLRLGGTTDDQRLREGLQLTLADRFVSRLPGGLDEDLAERGANLSMGERQLLSFTRAIVRDPDLLILDEATSAVDPATEALISRSMSRILEGRTALVIAHRLSTIRDADRILVLRRGEVVEAGSHDSLYAADGLYRVLHDLQFREARRAETA